VFSLKVAVVVCVSHAYDVVLVMSDLEVLTYPDYNVTNNMVRYQFRMDDPYTRNGDKYAWFTAINS
jgi:hypothetical protein